MSQDADTETTQAETQDTAETSEANTSTEAAPEAKAFDPATIPAEIKEYFERQSAAERAKYADYDRVSQAAKEWEQVRSDPRFVEWTRALSNPQPKAFEIDNDRFTKALSDPSEFARLVQDAAKHLVENQFRPQIEQTQNQVAFQNKLTEVKEVAAKYPDFKDLDAQGKIEPLIRKYPNLSFEDAYWLAKKDTFDVEVDKKARGLVDKKKTASVERPGNPPSGKTSKVQVKSRVEAMELAYDAAQAGRPIPEFEFVGE